MRVKRMLVLLASVLMLAILLSLAGGRKNEGRFSTAQEGGLVLQKNEEGLFVLALTPDGPASRSGLRCGDTLLAINGKRLLSPDDLASQLQLPQADRLLILREGEQLEISIEK